VHLNIALRTSSIRALHFTTEHPQIIRVALKSTQGAGFALRLLHYYLASGDESAAKNIFVEDPKKGRRSTDVTGDFWNLVGARGPNGKGFNGNVLLRTRKRLGVKAFRRAQTKVITSAFASALNEKVKSLARCGVASNASDSDLHGGAAYRRIFPTSLGLESRSQTHQFCNVRKSRCAEIESMGRFMQSKKRRALRTNSI